MSLRSMTGFAGVEGTVLERRVKIEARSFNSRYLEVRLRLPDSLSGIESGIQALLREYVSRGRVEVSVSFEQGAGDPGLSWNRERAQGYIDMFNEMQKELKLAGEPDLALLLSQKDVIIAADSGVPGGEVWPEIKPVFDRCFEDLRRMRENEGSALAADLAARVDNINSLVDRIEETASGLAAGYIERLKRRMEEMLGRDVVIDESRLAQEAALMAERSDITEELVRLRSHREKFLEIMEGSEPVGRKLEFLSQEMNREANTIGSKAQNAVVSQLVVEIKSELERVREQLQNIE